MGKALHCFYQLLSPTKKLPVCVNRSQRVCIAFPLSCLFGLATQPVVQPTGLDNNSRGQGLRGKFKMKSWELKKSTNKLVKEGRRKQSWRVTRSPNRHRSLSWIWAELHLCLPLSNKKRDLSCIILICEYVTLSLAVFKCHFVTAWEKKKSVILIRAALGAFLCSRCSGPCLRKLFFFIFLLFLSVYWRHKWRVIVLFSRSLLNVSPTQIFGQSQERRNVSGAPQRKKILVVGGHEDLQQYFGHKGMSVKCIQTQMRRKSINKRDDLAG